MPTSSSTVLCWSKRLLSADDLRRHLTSQRELQLLPRTVITPLAADELKAKGVRIRWQEAHLETASESAPRVASESWNCALEKPDSLIASVLQNLPGDGPTVTIVDLKGSIAVWVRSLAESLLHAGNRGVIVFCIDPNLVCCIANKFAGLRAACVRNAAQVRRVQASLAANFFAIEQAGPTWFELRHMIQTIRAEQRACPEATATLFQELDGHAHR